MDSWCAMQHISLTHTNLSLFSSLVVWNTTGVVPIRHVERVQKLFLRYAHQSLGDKIYCPAALLNSINLSVHAFGPKFV